MVMNSFADGLTQTQKAVLIWSSMFLYGAFSVIAAPEDWPAYIWVVGSFAFLPLSLFLGYDAYVQLIPYSVRHLYHGVMQTVTVGITALGFEIEGAVFKLLLSVSSFCLAWSEYVSHLHQSVLLSTSTPLRAPPVA